MSSTGIDQNIVELRKIWAERIVAGRATNAILTLEQSSGALTKTLSALAGLRPVLSTDPVTGSLSIKLDTSVAKVPDSITGMLSVIQQMAQRKKLVVFIDEFQDVLHLPDHAELLAIMRSQIQFQGDIPYVYAGSIRNRMQQMFYDMDSPFYKSALPLEVGSLDDKCFSTFLLKKFCRGGRDVSEDVIHPIFEITGRATGDVQALCAALWDQSSSGDELGLSALPSALVHIFAQESKGYEMALVQLTGTQIKCLAALARVGGTSPYSMGFMQAAGIGAASSVTRALNRLESMRIIYKRTDGYVFSNPFFSHWLVWKNL